jgi:hypothetical protein
MVPNPSHCPCTVSDSKAAEPLVTTSPEKPVDKGAVESVNLNAVDEELCDAETSSTVMT